MTVQLPNNFVIANLGKIKEVDFVPGLKRRALEVHCIQMPVNFTAVVEVNIAQQAKMMPADFIGFIHNGVNFSRQVLAQQANAVR